MPDTFGDAIFADVRPKRPLFSKRERALHHAARGRRVFPLQSNGKTPAHAGVNWQKIASCDPQRVHEMWTDPVFDSELDWNIGWALDPDDLIFDEDVRDGKTGDASREILESIYGVLPSTTVTRTPSGGVHRCYKTPTLVRNSASKVATHIDIKTEGGFVVAAGSTIDGVAYEVIDASPIATAPSWLTTLAGAPRERSKTATGQPLVDLDSDAAISRAIDWLTTAAPENGTYAVAARVKDIGISEAKCTELLLEHWPAGEAKGEDHVAFRVANAYRYGQNAPGIAAPESEFESQPISDRLRGGIQLQPITPFDALDIPKRQWVLGSFVAKRYVAGLVSPPGVGKTTFLIMAALAIVTGRNDIVDMKVHQRGRVLLWNQEDETDELKRRLLAVMAAFEISWGDLQIDGKPGLVIGSGVDRRLIVAKRDGSGAIVATPDAKTIEDYIQANVITVAIFDPFVEMHGANENDNTEIAVVGGIFRRIAVNANCAVLLAHHTRKPPAAAASDAYAGNMDTARGAGALNGVARMVATLYAIDAATGKKYGLKEDECRRYIRFDDAKANMSLIAGEARFFRREGVTIGGFGGEEVGVLRPVVLNRERSAKEVRSNETAIIRDQARVLLRGATGHRMPSLDIARALIERGLIELLSEDTLNKRLKGSVFKTPHRFENGDTIELIESARLAGRKGRVAVLTATFAEG